MLIYDLTLEYSDGISSIRFIQTDKNELLKLLKERDHEGSRISLTIMSKDDNDNFDLLEDIDNNEKIYKRLEE